MRRSGALCQWKHCGGIVSFGSLESCKVGDMVQGTGGGGSHESVPRADCDVICDVTVILV